MFIKSTPRTYDYRSDGTSVNKPNGREDLGEYEEGQ